jgi:hypothetical protein
MTAGFADEVHDGSETAFWYVNRITPAVGQLEGATR